MWNRCEIDVKSMWNRRVTLNLGQGLAQVTLTCPKSTIEALEGVKYIQNRHHDVVLVFLFLTLNVCHTFF